MKRLSSIAVMLALLAAPILVRADTDVDPDQVSGVWNISGKVEGFPVTVRCAFERHGEQLGGVCRDDGTGQAHVLSAGVVHGDEVSWTYRRRFLVTMFEPKYTGQIDGGSMTGVVSVAGHKGAFTAARE